MRRHYISCVFGSLLSGCTINVIELLSKCRWSDPCQRQPLPRQSPLLIARTDASIIKAISFTHIRRVNYSSGCHTASSRNTKSFHPQLSYSEQSEADVLLLQRAELATSSGSGTSSNKTSSRSVTSGNVYGDVTTSNNAYALWCLMWYGCLNNGGAGTLVQCGAFPLVMLSQVFAPLITMNTMNIQEISALGSHRHNPHWRLITVRSWHHRSEE